jgi:response regulator RpfG family c-di-GMP phosphodiesterase
MSLAELKQDASIEEIAQEQNHYVSHLAEVNKSNDVVSTEDIRNEKGVLLVRKGARISHSVADKILNHKLIKPLEQQVRLENTLDTDSLHSSFASLLAKYPDVSHIHEKLDADGLFKSLFDEKNINSIILQKLTVFQDRLLEEYEKTIFCAWLSALIAKEVGLQDNMIKAAFIAGLSHDIGLLHIDPETVFKKGGLTPAEWRAIQSHVVIGQLMLKNMVDIDSSVADAVLQHHERCDGSGYPVGKTEEQLEVMGQIVGMADSMQAIRVNQFTKCGRNLRDAMPYLHMNSNTHFLIVYRAMCSILQKSELPPTGNNPFGDSNALVSHLLIRGKKLKNAVVLLDQVLELSQFMKPGTSINKLVKVTQPVVSMIRTSGLVRDEIIQWLETLQSQPDSSVLDDLTEMDLMQNELYWQLRKVCKMVNDYLDTKGRTISPEHTQQLERIAKNIDGFLAG